VPTSTAYDAEHWRRRAAEMRRIAGDMAALPHASASIMRIADEYDRLALRAEERLWIPKPSA
jgi:hypothetical protein